VYVREICSTNLATKQPCYHRAYDNNGENQNPNINHYYFGQLMCRLCEDPCHMLEGPSRRRATPRPRRPPHLLCARPPRGPAAHYPSSLNCASNDFSLSTGLIHCRACLPRSVLVCVVSVCVIVRVFVRMFVCLCMYACLFLYCPVSDSRPVRLHNRTAPSGAPPAVGDSEPSVVIVMLPITF
jgi:hypothetical protein